MWVVEIGRVERVILMDRCLILNDHQISVVCCSLAARSYLKVIGCSSIRRISTPIESMGMHLSGSGLLILRVVSWDDQPTNTKLASRITGRH